MIGTTMITLNTSIAVTGGTVTASAQEGCLTTASFAWWCWL